jgi:periplasmic divalent cation tolerance protein
MNTLLIMYITTPSQGEATQVATLLLEKKLIACANTFSVDSTYWWNNTIQKGNEVVLLVKTLPHLFGKIKEEITAMHPYEVPLVAGFPAEVNDAYFSYMNNVIQTNEEY